MRGVCVVALRHERDWVKSAAETMAHIITRRAFVDKNRVCLLISCAGDYECVYDRRRSYNNNNV